MTVQSEIFSPPVTFTVADSDLTQIREKYASLSAATPQGYKEVQSAIAVLRTMRTKIEARRKDLKKDSLEWGRKVDREADRLKAIIESIEDPLKEQKRLVDDRKAKEKREKEEAERKRVEAEAAAKLAAEKERLDAERKSLEEFRERSMAEAKAIAEERERLQKENEALLRERAKMDQEREALLASQMPVIPPDVINQSVSASEVPAEESTSAPADANEEARAYSEIVEVMTSQMGGAAMDDNSVVSAVCKIASQLMKIVRGLESAQPIAEALELVVARCGEFGTARS